MNSTYRARGWRVGEAASVTICRAYARRSFSSFASRFGAARQVASAAPRFTPRNPAPTLAAHGRPRDFTPFDAAAQLERKTFMQIGAAHGAGSAARLAVRDRKHAQIVRPRRAAETGARGC